MYNLLYKRSIDVTDKISIYVPTVGEILDDEEEYYDMVSILTAMPIDMMVQLDDAGIDFSKIDEYQLFLLYFQALKEFDTTMIFGDLDLSKFDLSVNEESEMFVLLDTENDIIIDRVVQGKIANVLRKIHHLEKNRKKPGNEEARQYMLERARKKAKSKRNANKRSQLEQLIISMVNTEQFKYGYESVRDLTIYQFNESVRQIDKKIDFDNKMFGVYSGSIDPKQLTKEELTWLMSS